MYGDVALEFCMNRKLLSGGRPRVRISPMATIFFSAFKQASHTQHYYMMWGGEPAPVVAAAPIEAAVSADAGARDAA